MTDGTCLSTGLGTTWRRYLTVAFAAVIVLLMNLDPVESMASPIQTRVVDVQKVLITSHLGKEAKAKLAALASGYETDKAARERRLKAMKADLETPGGVSDSSRGAKEREYRQKLEEYKAFIKNAEGDLRAQNDKLTDEIVAKIVECVTEYGHRMGYSFIFRKSEATVYVKNASDITDDVLTYFDQKYRSQE